MGIHSKTIFGGELFCYQNIRIGNRASKLMSSKRTFFFTTQNRFSISSAVPGKTRHDFEVEQQHNNEDGSKG